MEKPGRAQSQKQARTQSPAETTKQSQKQTTSEQPSHSAENATAPSKRQKNTHPTPSREKAAAEYADKRKARSKRNILKVAAVVFLCAILALGGTAFAYVVNLQTSLSSRLDADLSNSLKQVSDGEPFYMLLLGIDKDQERAQSSNYGPSDSAYRTDSMMLARIDPKEKQVTLVSLHRDTLMDLGKNGKQKLNAAYPCGGAAYTVDIVSDFAGVPISHYAEIDFDQFASIVDALGGVEVDVPIDIDDPHVGAPIKKGKQVLNGEQALELCRSRHAYDDYGDGDVYRAANQRMVIEQICKKLLSADPATMATTIQKIAGAITTDLSISDIIALANDMRGIDIDNDVFTGMEPTSSLYTNNTWYEVCNIPEWRTMMMRVAKGLSPYSSVDQDPANGAAGGKVNIKNSADGSDTIGDATDSTFNTATPSSASNSSSAASSSNTGARTN